MQEQANEKSVALVVRTAKMTASAFARVCKWYIRHRNVVKHDRLLEKRYDPSLQKINQPRKIMVKELVKEGAGVASVEIKDEKIRQFERIARRNGVRYAIKKDKSTTPPTYIVFFKAKDGEVIDRTMKEFLKRSIKKGNIVYTPWCKDSDCEDKVKEKVKEL